MTPTPPYSDSDGFDLNAVGVGNRQTVFGQTLKMERDALADELLHLFARLAGDPEPWQRGDVRAPARRASFDDDGPSACSSVPFLFLDAWPNALRPGCQPVRPVIRASN
jgi:hypothetical protein